MTRSRKNKTANDGTSSNKDELEKYDMQLSRQRLSNLGFSPAITSLSPDEVIEKWLRMVSRQVQRQTGKDDPVTRVEPQTRVCTSSLNYYTYF